jgi:hypothetical protein
VTPTAHTLTVLVPYGYTALFLPLFIGDANRVAHIAAAILCKLPCNRGGVGFRALEVGELLSMYIPVRCAFTADDIKEV